jgi:DNA-binding MurR/RpiR family transcriptional regulator
VQPRVYASVAEQLRACMDELPAAERRIARVLLAQYPAAGLDTASRLAEQAGTSTPTAVRLVARLGYERYRDFQQALRDELDDRHASPLTLPAPAGTDTAAGLRALSVAIHTRGIEQTMDAVLDVDLTRAIDLLSSQRRLIGSVGGRFTHVMAEYLDLHLRLLRPGTRFHEVRSDSTSTFVVDAGKRDVVVVFDVRRYQKDVIELAHRLHDRGATLVVVTDPWLSPAASVADVVLPVRIEGPSPFDSLVPVMALVETLIAGVQDRLGGSAHRRLEVLDEFSPHAAP